VRIIICDDNPVERNLLKRYLESIGSFTITEMDNASMLIDNIKAFPADIIFLDIDMPGISGIEASKKIRTFNSESTIVFVTAHEQYAMEAFSVYALDYIVKPVTIERLKKTLGRIISNKGTTNDTLINIKYKQSVYKVRQEEIILVEKNVNKCYVYTKDFTYETVSSIRKFEEMLDKNIFVKTHSGFIVNRFKILKIVPSKYLSYKIYFSDIKKVAHLSRSNKALLGLL